MRRIKAHVAHGDAITLARPWRATSTVRVRADGVVGVVSHCTQGSVNDAYRVPVLLHVMHAHDVDPSKRAECTRGHGGGESIGWSPVDDATERGLAAGA